VSRAVAEALGIDLSSWKEGELFKWLLVCLLFGKPIRQEIAERAYSLLVSAGLRNPDAVLGAGWDKLVELLDKAHYVRYDFSTATKLLDVCQELKQRYGILRRPDFRSSSTLAPVTARIFTREVGPIWYGSPKSRRRAAEQQLQTHKTGAQ
jgi:hypothetical protein